MSVDDPRKVLRGLHEALNKRDLDKVTSFFADDIVGTSPEGIWKGKAENRRYFEWMFKSAADNKVTDVRLVEKAMYAQGNVVTHVYSMEGTAKNGKLNVPCVAVIEVKDGKITHAQIYYDRLTLAKQIASGVVATRAINAVVNQMEKGLRKA